MMPNTSLGRTKQEEIGRNLQRIHHGIEFNLIKVMVMKSKSITRRLPVWIILILMGLLSCKTTEDKSQVVPELLPPRIYLLIPNTGKIGDIIKIIGDNYLKVKENIIVNFGTKKTGVVDLDDNVVTFKVPDLPGENFVSVTVNERTSNSLKFICSKVSADTIEDFSSKDKAKVKAILDNKEPVNWVFTGNSITQGAKHTHGMRSYPEIFAERIRWELQRTSDYIINTAISGHTSKNIHDDFNRRVAQFNPRVVVLMIGTNDAATTRNITLDQYESNIYNLIDLIRGIGAIPVLLSPTPIIAEKSPERSRLIDYVVKMKEVARLKNVIFVDNYSIWSTDLNEKYNGEVFKKLLNDPLHPNGFGHQEIAIALFKELSVFDPQAATCGGPYYEGEH